MSFWISTAKRDPADRKIVSKGPKYRFSSYINFDKINVEGRLHLH